jgi:hypothetical protein
MQNFRKQSERLESDDTIDGAPSTFDCEAALVRKDVEIATAVVIERERVRRTPMIASEGKMPVPEALERLQSERNAIVIEHVRRLEVMMGHASFSRLDRYVHSEFVNRLTIRDGKTINPHLRSQALPRTQ